MLGEDDKKTKTIVILSNQKVNLYQDNGPYSLYNFLIQNTDHRVILLDSPDWDLITGYYKADIIINFGLLMPSLGMLTNIKSKYFYFRPVLDYGKPTFLQRAAELVSRLRGQVAIISPLPQNDDKVTVLPSPLTPELLNARRGYRSRNYYVKIVSRDSDLYFYKVYTSGRFVEFPYQDLANAVKYSSHVVANNIVLLKNLLIFSNFAIKFDKPFYAENLCPEDPAWKFFFDNISSYNHKLFYNAQSKRPFGDTKVLKYYKSVMNWVSKKNVIKSYTDFLGL